MAIDTLRGMDVYVDERGEYHFLTKGGSVVRATNSEENWTFVGVMYPHMSEEGGPPLWPRKQVEGM
jgi:hypothetical protein